MAEFSKEIPADSCVVFARGIWDSLTRSSSCGGRGDAEDADGNHRDRVDGVRGHDLDPSGEDSLVAAYRSNEAFSDALQASKAKISEYTQVKDECEKIDVLGAKMRDVRMDALAVYDDSAAGFVDEPNHARKPRDTVRKSC
jgi:hypothetical protein